MATSAELTRVLEFADLIRIRHEEDEKASGERICLVSEDMSYLAQFFYGELVPGSADALEHLQQEPDFLLRVYDWVEAEMVRVDALVAAQRNAVL